MLRAILRVRLVLRWPILLSYSIILLLELRLAEDIIGFVDFFEIRLIAVSLIGMVLFGQKVELLLNFLKSRLLVHSQNFIIIFVEVYKGML